VDVLSVKEFPKRALLAALPRDFDILCTHPRFGPDSGAGSWAGLAFVYDKVRVGASAARQKRVAALLSFFEAEGCRMVPMPCEEHDRLAAGTQFLTHTVGRVLGSMGVGPTEVDTRGYQSLLSLVTNTANDSFDLYYGLFMYNPVREREGGKWGAGRRFFWGAVFGGGQGPATALAPCPTPSTATPPPGTRTPWPPAPFGSWRWWPHPGGGAS
jgi:hypothetical protein